jgi:broad specificity phosphatase PhoE
MSEAFLIRHAETAWTLSGRHTGRTDLPLTTGGEAVARRLAARFVQQPVAQVLTSPLQRALRTCELAGFADRMALEADLMEWRRVGACSTMAALEARAPPRSARARIV